MVDSRICYVNGEFVSGEEARISPFDRGYLFADAVYEVNAVIDGRLVDFEGHLNRLDRSLGALKMPNPMNSGQWLALHREIVDRNSIDCGLVYIQVSRGVAERDFAIPQPDLEPTVFLTGQSKDLINNPAKDSGLSIITLPDKRWGMCDIKTVQLLYASLAKSEAISQGANDAWMERDGMVTEGSSNNAYIVTADKKIVTKNLGTDILAGITREALLACATELGYVVEERAFSVAEAEEAEEAFLTSAGTFVLPVVKINGRVLHNGSPGPVSEALREAYVEQARQTAV